MASPSCFRLFWQFERLAASRTFCTAGSSRPIKITMIAMTTSNSISVKAMRRRMIALLLGTTGGSARCQRWTDPDKRKKSINLEVERVGSLGLDVGAEGRLGIVLRLNAVLGYREVARWRVR